MNVRRTVKEDRVEVTRPDPPVDGQGIVRGNAVECDDTTRRCAVNGVRGKGKDETRLFGKGRSLVGGVSFKTRRLFRIHFGPRKRAGQSASDRQSTIADWNDLPRTGSSSSKPDQQGTFRSRG